MGGGWKISSLQKYLKFFQRLNQYFLLLEMKINPLLYRY